MTLAATKARRASRRLSSAASWRYSLIYVAGDAQRESSTWTREGYPGFLVRRALKSGARIPRSLRRYL